MLLLKGLSLLHEDLPGTEDAAGAAAFRFCPRPAAGIVSRRRRLGEQRQRIGDVRFGAFRLPQQIVFAQKTPVTARLRRPTDVARLQEGQDVESQLFGQQRDEISLELGLDHRHHVFYLKMDERERI